ncbi:MAG: Urease alpha subunit, partial [uncultured Thermomicrobiales bacterium]
ADGLSPPQPPRPGGRRVRRLPHPRPDDRRRGRAPRPRRALDHGLRLPGDGPRRRDDPADLAGRRQDEAAARPPARRHPPSRQRPDQALPGEVHDQPCARPRHRPRGRLDRAGQAGRPGPLATPLLRRQTGNGPGRRPDRPGCDGRPKRLDPNPPAGPLPPDVRPPRPPRDRRHLRLPVGARRRGAAATGPRQARRRRRQHPTHRQGGHGPQRRNASDRGRPGDLRGAGGRGTADQRAGAGAAAGAAVLSVL